MPEPRYRFSVDHENEDGRTTFSNTLEFDAEMLPDVIGNFELFLRGAGFVFDGHVDIQTSNYTETNTYNNHPDPVYYDNSDVQIKRPADTEGGSIE
jgi:hypothetical protein